MNLPGTLRRNAAIRLLFILAMAGIAGCSIPGLRKPGTATPAAPGIETDTAPAAAHLTDSLTRDTAQQPDSVAPTLAGDSALIADSLARLAALLDSTARADSILAEEAAKKKAAPATRSCILDFSESPEQTRLLYSRISDVASSTFIGGGFVGHCQGENNRISADSAEHYQGPGILNLYGNVVYEEPGKFRVEAPRATYFTSEGRLYADGNVTATELATGSSFSGPVVEYYRETPGRPLSRLIAPLRSTAKLIEKDSLGRASPPTVIVANRFEDAGDSLLMAWGDVIIDREKLHGKSDSASFDKLSERSRLIRGAEITSTDSSQSFVLVGDTIDLFSTDRELDRVLALHQARATSDQMQLLAERIDMRLVEQRLSEVFASGAGRPQVHTAQQDVEADSLRIRLVDDRVREVHAVGKAVALGSPDTLKMRTDEKDILSGSRILAFFDSSEVAESDSTGQNRIREIRAMGNASSLFHMANSKGINAPPAINYVRGQAIFVKFDTGAVREVLVDSSASGVYLEPEADSLADSLSDSVSKRSADSLSDSLRDSSRTGGTPVKPDSIRRTPPDPIEKTPPREVRSVPYGIPDHERERDPVRQRPLKHIPLRPDHFHE